MYAESVPISELVIDGFDLNGGLFCKVTEDSEVVLRHLGIYADGVTIGIGAPRGELHTVSDGVM